MEQLLRIEEVAMLIGVSTQTINNWYRWKRQNPTHKLANLLPEYTQTGERQTRYWKKSDTMRMVEFRNSLPHGRNGILGDVTQKRKK